MKGVKCIKHIKYKYYQGGGITTENFSKKCEICHATGITSTEDLANINEIETKVMINHKYNFFDISCDTAHGIDATRYIIGEPMSYWDYVY